MASRLRLMTAGEVPLGNVQLFRVSLAGPLLLVLTVGVWVIACAWVWWAGGIEKVKIPAALAGWAVFWIGLYWVYVLNDLRKAMHAGAWIAALGPDGVYVNLRSYRNLGRAAGTHVLLLPYALIAHAQGDAATVPAQQDGAESRLVEMKLRDAETAELEERLAEERDGPLGAVPLISVLWKPSPVSLEPGMLRIEWRAKPGVGAFLHLLSRRGVTVAQSWHTVMRRPS